MSGAAELAARLGALLGARIDGLQQLSGGASRETWSFDAVSDGARQALVLRRDPPGRPRLAGAMAVEADLFRAAAAAGVPVPRLHRSGTGSDSGADALETDYLLMDRVAGETLARRILRDERYATARTRLVGQLARAAARIHAIPIDDVPGLVPADPLDVYGEILHGFTEPHPAFELGIRWLQRNRPPTTAQVVVHGDLRLGNVIVDGDGLAAVLDWELAHLGDPAEDLGWLCVRAWRFGAGAPVAGVGGYEALLDAYAHESGRRIPLDVLRWWEAVGTLKWGVLCMQLAATHLDGAHRSVELAAIGRRVCETEHDLLALLP